MQIRRRNTVGIVFSLLLVLGAAASFTSPRSQALAAQNISNELHATKATSPLIEGQSTEVTSTDRHTACKQGCEEKYSNCVAAKIAKGWSDDRAERICGLSARSCRGGCNRR